MLSTIRHVSKGFNATSRLGTSDVIKNITVIGGGVMGSGIAQVCAQKGFPVKVVDVEDKTQQRCMTSIANSLDTLSRKKYQGLYQRHNWIGAVMDNIKMDELKSACRDADLIIESVNEDMSLKRNVYKEIRDVIPDHTLVACNTSPISIQEISHDLGLGDRFMGMQFFNPVWKMELVEIAASSDTSLKNMDKLFAFAKKIVKRPVYSLSKEVYFKRKNWATV